MNSLRRANSLMLLAAIMGGGLRLMPREEDFIIVDASKDPVDPPDRIKRSTEKLPPQLTKQVQGPPSPYREDYPSRQMWRAAMRQLKKGKP